MKFVKGVVIGGLITTGYDVCRNRKNEQKNDYEKR